MRQDSWVIHEAAILLEKYLQFASGKLTRKDAIEFASNNLRKMAINQGKQINATFRNVAGITFQLASMESAYLGYTKLKPATKLFSDIVHIYRTDRKKYKHLLCEANAMIHTRYMEWLRAKVSDDTISDFILAYSEIDEYCFSKKLLSIPFLDTTDINIIKDVQALMIKRSAITVSHKIAIQCYIQFLQECPNRSIALTNSVYGASQQSHDTSNQTQSEKSVLYEKLYHTLKDLSNKGSGGASALMLYEYVGGSISEVTAILDSVSWAEKSGKTYRYIDDEHSNSVESQPIQNAELEKAIIRKSVDKSLLSAGLTVPKSVANELMSKLGVSLNKGEGCDLQILLDSNIYQAKLISVNFSQQYSNSVMLQIRYSASSPICKKLNEVFADISSTDSSAYVDIYVTGKSALRFECSKNTAVKIEPKLVRKTEVLDVNSDADMVQRFAAWMQNKGMAEATVRSYSSSIRSAQQYAVSHRIENINLLSANSDEILQSMDALLSHKGFIQYNQEQHNRFSAAFRKLRDFLAEVTRREEQLTSDAALEVKYPKLYRVLYSISKVYDDPEGMPIGRILALTGLIEPKRHVVEFLDNISWAYKLSDGVYSFSKKAARVSVAEEESKNEDTLPVDYDKDAFVTVLMRRFPSGMEFDSIDLEIFRDTYSDLHDETLAFSDAELEKRLRLCGVMYKDRIFPADGIVDPATKERLFAYIENQFATGSKVLYYKAIFADLADAFAYCFSLTDEIMLKAYLEFVSDEGKYFFTESYMSKEANVEVDHAEEVANFMLDAGKPLSYEDIYAGLSHIDKDIIYREIHVSSKFVMNEKEHYFHIDIFEFSQADGDRIAAILNKEIDENGYAIWSKAFERIQEQLPIFLENNLYLSSLGIRNALSQRMSDCFNFEGEVISTCGVRLSMGDVFRLYARHHAPFSDKQIYEFSKEVGSPTYFWALAEESVRVSKSLFVAKDQIHFDVDAVDKALETYLVSGYILLKEVDSFLVFPNVGYEWNEYLLESFLLHYSKKYTLVNNGTSLNNVAGAIAKKDGEFTQFVDVCAQALADSNVELKKAPALNYLAELNLITRRSYKELESAMTKARRIRNRKG